MYAYFMWFVPMGLHGLRRFLILHVTSNHSQSSATGSAFDLYIYGFFDMLLHLLSPYINACVRGCVIVVVIQRHQILIKLIDEAAE